MKKIILLILLSTLLSTLFFSCSKQNNPIDNDWKPFNEGIFILNEGLYGRNNSEVSHYDLKTKRVIDNFYSAANGKPLGDNANSLYFFEGKAFIAVDASNKIEVMNLADGKSLGIIDLGAKGSPREIFILNSTRGFVTSFSKNIVIEFNPKTLSITREIPVGKFPEGIVYKESKLFVANSDLGNGTTVSVIDINTNSVIKTISVGRNPRMLSLSNDGKIFVSCSGDFFNANFISGFYVINPASSTVVDSIKLAYHPQDFTISKNNLLYYINDRGVGRINLTTKNVDTVFISGSTVNDIFGIPYTLTFDEITEQLYVSNPKDFTQNGEIKIFDKNGNYISKFDVKINPGGIYIYR
jgi:YVTN family beta-propeller protein